MERNGTKDAPRAAARRRFLQAIPAAVAGSLAAPAFAQQQQQAGLQEVARFELGHAHHDPQSPMADV